VLFPEPAGPSKVIKSGFWGNPFPGFSAILIFDVSFLNRP
jgi:hypothetical protein